MLESKREFARSRQRGAVLPLVIIGVVLLAVVGLGMYRLSLQARVYASRAGDEIAAQVAADAALERAIAEMNQKLSISETKESTSSVKADDVQLANCEATYSFKINANSIEAVMKKDSTITATGRSGLAEKTIYATVRLGGGPFEYAVFADGGMTLKPNTVVDGYDSREGAYDPKKALTGDIGTNSTDKAAVTIGGGAVVNGDVVVGFEGDPDAVISADKAKITGQTTAMSEEQELPSVTVPAWVGALPKQAKIKGSTVITESGKYDGIDLGKGGTVTIDGAVTLYVTGNIGLGNSAALEINEENPEASLTLYLGGDLYMKNGGMINNLTEDPRRLKVYGLDSCKNMSLATAGVLYGAVYAPNSPMYIKSALEIYGSVVCDVFAQGSTSNFHYDISLKDENPDFWPRSFDVVRWWE